MDVTADEQKYDFWDFGERNVELYDLSAAHYKANLDVNIEAHEKDEAADSDSYDKR